MQTNPILALLRSRKFLTALLGVVAIIAIQFGVPEDKANDISAAIGVLLTVVIGGIAYEDGQAKSVTGGKDDPTPPINGYERGGFGSKLPILLMLLLPLVSGCAAWTKAEVEAEQARYDVVAPLVDEHVTARPQDQVRYGNWLWSWQQDIYLHGGKAPTTQPVTN